MTPYLALLVLLLAVGGFSLWRKYRKLTDEVGVLRRQGDEQESLIRALTERVFRLEGGVPAAPRAPAPPPLPALVEALATSRPQTELPAPRDDWETIVGANWLNRVGALVLVIGIALFLGYSLTHLGPAGKV